MPANTDLLRPDTMLHLILSKRNDELTRLELRLDEPDCPISAHSLYRNLLRDVEAQCYKLMELPAQVTNPSNSAGKVESLPTPKQSTVSKLSPLSCIASFILALILGWCSTNMTARIGSKEEACQTYQYQPMTTLHVRSALGLRQVPSKRPMKCLHRQQQP
jgi:hypothetical protein